MADNRIINYNQNYIIALLFISVALVSATPTVNPTAVCNTTLYPGYCSRVLKSDNQTSATVHDYAHFSLKRSIKQASKFLRLVRKYLRRKSSWHLTPLAVGALQDCHVLTQLNLDYLDDTVDTLKTTNQTLSDAKADDVHTLLSALLTNQHTCLDGLKSAAASWSFLGDGLSAPLSNDTKLYSVSLSLVSEGWIPMRKKKGKLREKGRSHSGFGKFGGRAPPVSDSGRRSRKLSDDEQVMVSDIVVVSQNGTSNFTTIMEAVAAAPNNTDGSDGYFLIYVTAGVYEEYVSIDKRKKYILMIGDGINRTIITGNRSVVDGWTTFSSATFAVMGTGFVGVEMSIRNTAGPSKHQAVALRNNADLSAFYRCSFEGYQDTLYTHSLRQFYSDCDIYGTVDFIFGNAAVVFQTCNLYPRRPLSGQFNAVTAQGRTDPNQNTGISLQNCTVRPADDLAANVTGVHTYLGRPWKEYSRTVYMESYLHGFINSGGWKEWNGSFALDTLYYGEFNNTGPGSGTAKRPTWPGYHIMNASDAANFTVSAFLLADDWLPQTGVPYFSAFV